MIQAQKTLFTVIADNHAQFGVFSGNAVDAREALTELKTIVVRLLNHARDHGLSAIEPRLRFQELCSAQPDAALRWRYRRASSQILAPMVAAEAAVAITAALEVMNANDVTAAADRIGWLISAQYRRSAFSALAFQSIARETPMASAILLKTFAPVGGRNLTGTQMQLRYRTALPVPRVPDADRGRSRRIARRIPAMLWPAWSLRLFTRDQNYTSLRAELACATLLSGSAESLAEASALLGNVSNGASLHNALGLLQESPYWPGVCTAVTRLSEYLNDTAVPIDYRRRRHLTHSGLLSDQSWAQICRRTGELPGKSQGQKALVARAYLYEKICGRPARETFSRIPAATKVDLVSRVANFSLRLTPEVKQLLDNEGQHFLHTHRIDEPLTWQPPLNLIDDLDLPQPDPAATDIAYLHSLAAGRTNSISEVASCLNISNQAVRYLLGEHPAAPLIADRANNARAQACPTLTPEVLHDRYIIQGHTLAQIANAYGTNRFMVKRLLDRDQITTRRRPAPPDREWLHEQHIVRRRTLADIAEEFGVHERAVCAWKKLHQLTSTAGDSPPERPMDEAAARKVLQPVLATPTHWLHNFVTALSYDSVTLAADALKMQQPTLSYQIRGLEKRAGEPLVLRARHGLPMRATPHGQRIAQAMAILTDDPGSPRSSPDDTATT